MKIYTNSTTPQASELAKLPLHIHIELEYVEEAAMLMALVGSLTGDDSNKLINMFAISLNEYGAKDFSSKFISDLYNNLYDNIPGNFYKESLLNIKFTIE